MDTQESKTLEDFIEENRQSLIESITGQETVLGLDLDNEEIENHIMNTESLYNWAEREGVVL